MRHKAKFFIKKRVFDPLTSCSKDKLKHPLKLIIKRQNLKENRQVDKRGIDRHPLFCSANAQA